jgi:hypothetical protein
MAGGPCRTTLALSAPFGQYDDAGYSDLRSERSGFLQEAAVSIGEVGSLMSVD